MGHEVKAVDVSPVRSGKALGPSAEDLKQKAMDELKKNAIALSAKPMNEEMGVSLEKSNKKESTDYYKVAQNYHTNQNYCKEVKESENPAEQTKTLTCIKAKEAVKLDKDGFYGSDKEIITFDKDGNATKVVRYFNKFSIKAVENKNSDKIEYSDYDGSKLSSVHRENSKPIIKESRIGYGN